MVYTFLTFPFIPLISVVIFSLYSGSNSSKLLGTLILGRSNNFKLPWPDTLTVASNDSDDLSDLLFTRKSRLNSPTAPVKLSGWFLFGKSFTLITLFPALTDLETCL